MMLKKKTDANHVSLDLSSFQVKQRNRCANSGQLHFVLERTVLSYHTPANSTFEPRQPRLSRLPYFFRKIPFDLRACILYIPRTYRRNSNELGGRIFFFQSGFTRVYVTDGGNTRQIGRARWIRENPPVIES